MSTEKSIKYLSNFLFVIAFTISSALLISNPELSGIFSGISPVSIAVKSLIALILPAVAVAFCYYFNENDFGFLSLAGPIIIILQSLYLFIDKYTFEFYGKEPIYVACHVLYLIIAISSFAISGTLINKNYSSSGYENFLKSFNLSAVFCYFVLLIIFLFKTPQSAENIYSVNFELGKGAFSNLKTLFITGNLSYAYNFFGNLIFFAPLGYFISYYLRKLGTPLLLFLGIVFLVIVEIYQYSFNCDNVDIDEFVLNYIGYFLGYLTYKYI